MKLYKDRPILNYLKRLFEIKRKPFDCLYKNIICDEVNKLGMSEDGCENCKHYGDGVRLTGEITDLGLKKLWTNHSLKIIVILTLVALILILSSCEIESGEAPCAKVHPVEWNAKHEPIINVPIPGALDYYEVKALLYNDSNEATLMKNVIVKKDTVILNAKNIDLAEYQNDRQYCEIYLMYYN